MSMSVPVRDLIAELYSVEGKAEIIHGEIVTFMSTGGMPGYAADEIFASLRAYIRANMLPGVAVGDNKGFLVNLPHRQSLSPDAAYYEGPRPGMRFYPQAPRFAVEVRSENDSGAVAETEMRDKRADYFAAGTQVVWDVDLLHEPTVRKYVAPDADHPTALFHRGEHADAEPSVPGWMIPIDDLFE